MAAAALDGTTAGYVGRKSGRKSGAAQRWGGSFWLCSEAPRAGLEPATLRLTAGCSTIELPRNGSGQSTTSQPLDGLIGWRRKAIEQALVDQVTQVGVLAG